jgi:phenylacetate-CoA ligase
MDKAGTVGATDVLQMLMSSQHWSQDQMLAFQHSQLEQLLRHSRTTVPFFGNRLNCMFRSDGLIDWSRWTDIPILTRHNVADNFDGLQSTALPRGHGRTGVASTSGSTGLPITVTFTGLLSNVCRALDWRAHQGWKMDWSENLVYWRKYEEQHALKGPLFNYGSWGPSTSSQSTSGQSFVANIDTTMAERIQHLTEVNAQHLNCQGNFAMAAAAFMKESGLHIPLKSIVSHGVELDPQFDADILAAFGTKLLGFYSSKEGGRIAHLCGHCGKYHVNAEAVHVEILDGDNQPCPPGISGRVVVTNFYNAAQPFIRYEQGDVAAWSATSQCASKLPTLERLEGRVYHLFRRPNGERFAPLIPDEWRTDLGAVFWQFAQVDARTVVVNYKPHASRELRREEAFSELITPILGDDLDIRFNIVAKMPLTAAGKFLKYVYAVPDDKKPAR